MPAAFANLVAGDVIKLIVRYGVGLDGTSVDQNRFFYKVRVASSGDGWDAFIDAFDNGVRPDFQACQSSSVLWYDYQVSREYPPQVEAMQIYEPLSRPGTLMDIPVTSGVCAQINLSTVKKGPRGNGKKYIGGLGSSMISTDTLSGAGEVALDLLATDMVATLLQGGWTFDPVIRWQPDPAIPAIDYDQVASWHANRVLTTLITRRLNRGS